MHVNKIKCMRVYVSIGDANTDIPQFKCILKVNALTLCVLHSVAVTFHGVRDFIVRTVNNVIIYIRK